jgi:2-methylcitrate dehydratase PrpD
MVISYSITDEIVRFLLNRDSSPPDVKRIAIRHITDNVGVMLAGSRTECVRKIKNFIIERKSVGSSSLLGFGLRVESSDAALVNGTAGHVDDYDDTQLPSSPDRIYGLLTHPTTPVLAATLAVGEMVECTGREFLEAFIAGFEVECKIAEAIKPEHYKRGFHTTGTIGAFGACVASAKLLCLSEEELRCALGITASISSGIRANFGTMTKSLHVGRAASNGVFASILGSKGFTADKKALDGRWGFMEILGQGADSERIIGKLGNPFALIQPGASIKMYPCGSLAQPSMDALLQIVDEQGVRQEDVREIRVRAGPNILEPLRYANPADELQAKFSLNFGLASILLRRRASLREYSTGFLNSDEMQQAMKKVRTILDPEIVEMGTDKIRSIIEVELRNGRVFSKVAESARGTPEKPLQEAEVYAKFRECAGYSLDESEIETLFRKLQVIENISNIRELTDAFDQFGQSPSHMT